MVPILTNEDSAVRLKALYFNVGNLHVSAQHRQSSPLQPFGISTSDPLQYSVVQYPCSFLHGRFILQGEAKEIIVTQTHISTLRFAS